MHQPIVELYSIYVFHERGFDKIYDRDAAACITEFLPDRFDTEIRILRKMYAFIRTELELVVKIPSVPARIHTRKKARPYGAIAKPAWYFYRRPCATLPKSVQHREPPFITTLCQRGGICGIQTYE